MSKIDFEQADKLYFDKKEEAKESTEEILNILDNLTNKVCVLSGLHPSVALKGKQQKELLDNTLTLITLLRSIVEVSLKERIADNHIIDTLYSIVYSYDKTDYSKVYDYSSKIKSDSQKEVEQLESLLARIQELNSKKDEGTSI